MSRRHREDYAVPCTCRACEEHEGPCHGSHTQSITCARHEPCLVPPPPSWQGLRPHRTFLGPPRMPYEKWARELSLYTWPLWRNWKPKPPMRVETLAEQRIRQLSYKPTTVDKGLTVLYPWKLWHQHKSHTKVARKVQEETRE